MACGPHEPDLPPVGPHRGAAGGAAGAAGRWPLSRAGAGAPRPPPGRRAAAAASVGRAYPAAPSRTKESVVSSTPSAGGAPRRFGRPLLSGLAAVGLTIVMTGLVSAASGPRPSVAAAARVAPEAIHACTAAQLSARIVSWEGAAGSRIGNVRITNTSFVTCNLRNFPRVQLLSARGTVLINGQRRVDDGRDPRARPAPHPEGRDPRKQLLRRRPREAGDPRVRAPRRGGPGRLDPALRHGRLGGPAVQRRRGLAGQHLDARLALVSRSRTRRPRARRRRAREMKPAERTGRAA